MLSLIELLFKPWLLPVLVLWTISIFKVRANKGDGVQSHIITSAGHMISEDVQRLEIQINRLMR